jgi:hypothetical protein
MTHATDVTSVANWVRTLAGPSYYNCPWHDAARIMLYSTTVHEPITYDTYDFVWQVLAERSASNYVKHPDPPKRVCGIISDIYRELLTELGYTTHHIVQPTASYADPVWTDPAPMFEDHVAVHVFDGVNWLYQDADFGFKLIDINTGTARSAFALSASGDYTNIVPSNNSQVGWGINANGGPLPSDLKLGGFFDIIHAKPGDPYDILMVGNRAKRRNVTLNGIAQTLESVILSTATPQTIYMPGWSI